MPPDEPTTLSRIAASHEELRERVTTLEAQRQSDATKLTEIHTDTRKNGELLTEIRISIAGMQGNTAGADKSRKADVALMTACAALLGAAYHLFFPK